MLKRTCVLIFALLLHASPPSRRVACSSPAIPPPATTAPSARRAQGWGMQLQSFLDPAAWQVRNHAQSGRSSRSFIDEGWLDGDREGPARAATCC